MSETAVIVLAAGNSTRMGAAKQLMPYRGRPLLYHAVEQALDSECGPVVVVLGAREKELRKVLADLPVEIAVNRNWADGMGSSIQTGLRAIEGRNIDGAILCLADQPFVLAEFLCGLLEKHVESGRTIVASSYAGTVGVPVYFARKAFGKLLALAPNQGCKGVILENMADVLLVECPEAAMDIDTPADYARLAMELERAG